MVLVVKYIFIKRLGALFIVMIVMVILVVGVFASWVYCLGAFTLRAGCIQLLYVMSVKSTKNNLHNRQTHFTIYSLCFDLFLVLVLEAFKRLKRTYNCIGV